MTDAAATDATAQVKPDAAAGTQEPTLEQILAEYVPQEPKPAETGQPAKTEQPQIGVDDLREAVSYIKQDKQERIRQQTQTDLDSAVKAIKTELGDAPVSDRMVRNFIAGEAEFNEGMLRAWQNRHRDPVKWNGVLKAAARDFRKEMEARPDPDLTAAREAARASVRGSFDKPPADQPDWLNMPRGEFMSESDKLFRQNSAAKRRQA